MLRTTGRMLLGSSAALGAGLSYKVQTDEGVQRSFHFWRKAVPIYAHYRVKQWYMETVAYSEADQDQEYERLHDLHATNAFAIIRELKGFYIKLAQVGSTRPDFLPKQYLDHATALQDDAPGKSIDEIRAIIERSYGRPVDEIFETIDPTPLGTASIGQVHRAVLKQTGEQVAVKVQHPDAERLFRWDIKTIKDFCRTLQPSHLPYMEEIEKQFMTEFDYAAEARNLDLVRNNIAKSPYASQVVIPKPHLDLCTREVLVMEFLKGKKLMDGIHDHFEAISAAKNTTVEELKAEQERKDKERQALGLDVESGPDAQQMQLYLTSIAMKNKLRGMWNTMYDHTIGWIRPRSQQTNDKAHQLLNIPAILKLIMDVHGYEIFVDGAFNGDPHPGNIMLLEDGRLGLIDYGQVKHLNRQQRRNLAKLILALHEGTDDDILRIMTHDMGILTEKMDPYFLLKQARILLDTDDRDVTEGLNVQLFMEKLDKIDRFKTLPDDYVMAFRASLLLRGFSYWLRYRFSHADSWASFARQVLEEP